MNNKQDIIKYLEKRIKRGIENDIIKEQAWEYIDEDGKTKDEIMEEHEEIISEIENVDPQDDENKIWDNGYARGYEVAFKDLLYLINNKQG